MSVINQWNTRSAIRKEFCPNCEAETPCTHEAELFVCDICGEDFAKYIVSRNCNVSDVSMTRDVSTDIKTPPSIENTNPDYYKQEIARRDEIIKRLKEDADNLATALNQHAVEEIESEYELLFAHIALMKELE
jgi:ribosomal protein L37AE/L43A